MDDTESLFTNVTVWIDEELPNAAQLSRQIKNNGGNISIRTNEANYILLHPETRHYGRTYGRLGEHSAKLVTPHWVEDCILFRRKVDSAHIIYKLPLPDPTLEAQKEQDTRKTYTIKRTETGNRGGPRIKYTEEDDEILARAVAKYGARMERDTLCKLLGKRYPQHSWSSWKEHWRKVKKDWVESRSAQIIAENPNIGDERSSDESGPDVINVRADNEAPMHAIGYQSRKRRDRGDYAIEPESDEEAAPPPPPKRKKVPKACVQADLYEGRLLETMHSSTSRAVTTAPSAGLDDDADFMPGDLVLHNGLTDIAVPGLDAGDDDDDDEDDNDAAPIDPQLVGSSLVHVGNGNGRKKKKRTSLATPPEQHEFESVMRSGAGTAGGGSDRPAIVEPSARQLKKQQRENEADIVWASSGNTELAKRYLAAGLEEQVEMLEQLWQPEDDAIIIDADEDELEVFANEKGRAVEEVQARRAYMDKYRGKSRRPPGAQRWPFYTE